MPLPAADFDPTEVAVSWQVLAAAGHDVVFATPSGQRGRADDLMVTGQGLDPWGAVPGLRRLTVVGRVLRADADARAAYAGVAGGRGVRRAAALGRGPAQRLRRAGAAGRAPGARDASVSREPRGAADGDRRVPGREAGRRHLPRRPGGGAGRRSGHGALGAVRPADHRAHLGAGTTRPGASPATPGSGTRNYYRTYVEEPGQRWGYHVGAAGGHAGVGRSRRLRRRGEGLAGLAAQDERARPRHAGRRSAPPSSCATAPTCRPAGRATCTPSPGPSPRCWPSGPDRSAAVEHEVEVERRRGRPGRASAGVNWC